MNTQINTLTLCENCPKQSFYRSIFRTEYGELLCKSVWTPEYMDQKKRRISTHLTQYQICRLFINNFKALVLRI